MLLLLFWIVIVLLGFAVVIDGLLTDDQVQAWRKKTRSLHRLIEKLDSREAILTAHKMFCDLFDAIYGKKYWSWKRCQRSYLSSLVALGGVTLLLGWDTTRLGSDDLRGEDAAYHIFGVLVGIFVMNTVADYLSLQETRLVLERSKHSGVGSLIAIAAFDLLLTVVIWYGWMIMVYLVWVQIFDVEFNLKTVLHRDQGLAFFLSTFFTSAAWWLYLLSAMVIRIVMRQSRVFGLLLDAIAESSSPARMMATILSVLLVALYGLSAGVIWVVQTGL